MTVSFGRDALTDRVLDAVFAYIEPQKKQFRWGSNVLAWSPALIVGNGGAVLTHILPEGLTDSIYLNLLDRGILQRLPKNKIAMFYIWLPGSNITWHADYIDKQSMTIYLNKEWNPDHGGHFCWKDWGDDLPKHSYGAPPKECRMRTPEYNHYVHMTEAEWHTTTITAAASPPRLSLQMFFDYGSGTPLVAADGAVSGLAMT
jgi:hypothetical protein